MPLSRVDPQLRLEGLGLGSDSEARAASICDYSNGVAQDEMLCAQAGLEYLLASIASGTQSCVLKRQNVGLQDISILYLYARIKDPHSQ